MALLIIFLLVYLTPPLRQLSGAFVVIPPIVCALLLWRNELRIHLRLTKTMFAFMIFVCFTVWVAVVSLLSIGGLAELIFAPRLFYFSIGVLALYIYVSRAQAIDKELQWILIAYLLALGVGALGYFFQIANGPVGWFNDPGAQRGGVARYSTSLGSLTIYGTVVGVGLFLLWALPNLKTPFRAALTLLLVAGSVLSLQKAALVNIAFALTAYSVSVSSARRVLKGITVTVLVLGVLYYLIGRWGGEASEYVDAFVMNTLGFSPYGTHVRADDALSYSSIAERVLGYDLQLFFDKYSAFRLTITGIGALGAGSSMGISGHQAHNSFVDLLFMGGIGYLLVFLTLFVLVQASLNQLGGPISRALFGANIVFILNFFGASILPFHPVTSFVFWVSFVYVVRRQIYMNDCATSQAGRLDALGVVDQELVHRS